MSLGDGDEVARAAVDASTIVGNSTLCINPAFLHQATTVDNQSGDTQARIEALEGGHDVTQADAPSEAADATPVNAGPPAMPNVFGAGSTLISPTSATYSAASHDEHVVTPGDATGEAPALDHAAAGDIDSESLGPVQHHAHGKRNRGEPHGLSTARTHARR